ncbi:hypothetical protein VdG2_08639 [Verticillium dahliae VDG2]|nr:hypothetical protein VdG2_08639 [Verticillium dahliae VDG2]
MKKIIPDAVMDEAACLQMLSSVDYDMDRRPEFKHAFEHSLGVAKMCLSSPENGMRGLALAALLSYDIQQLVRMQHERWIREQHGAFSFGDLDMSPEECIPLAVGDCGGQGPYGYQNSEQYRLGKPSMFISMIVANSHDVLYDICSQNRVSNILYAEVKGGSLENWHTVLAHSGMDSIAERINLLKEGEVPLYGDTAALGTGCWAPFNGRYRSLERYIKYSKLLKRSQHPDAGKIMALSRQQWVYQDYNITHSDLVAYWKLSIDSDGIRQTKPRTRHTYKVVMDERLLSGDSILKGLDICGDCHGLLADKISNAQYSVTSAIELSPSVANASSVQWASLLVQVANWCSELQVCSTCAALIGNRLDEMAYRVLVELMKNEPKTSAKDFLAEHFITRDQAELSFNPAPISADDIIIEARAGTGFAIIKLVQPGDEYSTFLVDCANIPCLQALDTHVSWS